MDGYYLVSFTGKINGKQSYCQDTVITDKPFFNFNEFKNSHPSVKDIIILNIYEFFNKDAFNEFVK